MMTKTNIPFALGMTVLLSTSACLLPDDEVPETSSGESSVTIENKLGLNKLGLNKLGLNKLGLNKLGLNGLATEGMMETPESREVYSYVISCALGASQTITAQDADGNSYSFTGWLGLAPGWATRAPTVSERRWVTACLLARTNLYGVPVHISMRHDSKTQLLSSAAERALYTNTEGAFFGDLFQTDQKWFACSNRSWTPYAPDSLRMCALSANGSTTDCNFTYVGSCTSACTDKTSPFGSCRGGGVSYAEVITIFLTPSQQQGELE